MPASFHRCVAAGGAVRTKRLGGNRYMHICFRRGRSYAGEVRTRKAAQHRRAAAKIINGRRR